MIVHNDFEAAFAASHEALVSMAEANPRPSLELWSRRDDAVLANPLGPPEVGWVNIEKETMRVAAMFAGAVGAIEFEEVVRVVTPDLGYVVGFERTRVRRPGSDEITPLALRVTTVFRREEYGWKLVLRHADRVTSAT